MRGFCIRQARYPAHQKAVYRISGRFFWQLYYIFPFFINLYFDLPSLQLWATARLCFLVLENFLPLLLHILPDIRPDIRPIISGVGPDNGFQKNDWIIRPDIRCIPSNRIRLNPELFAGSGQKGEDPDSTLHSHVKRLCTFSQFFFFFFIKINLVSFQKELKLGHFLF